MNIGIITGGNTGERDVSFASAENVQNLLSIHSDYIFDYPKEKTKILKTKGIVDVFIPIIHGEGGEDGEIQALLEEVGIPYIFSEPKSHKLAINKRLAKEIAEQNGINVAKEFSTDDPFRDKVFVKPVFGGSSVVTLPISSQKELETFLAKYSEIDLIIEEAISGREFSVGVVENQGVLEALPVIEIKPKGLFFDYDNKHNEELLAEEICPADISESLREELQRQSVLIHEKLECKHFSRSDFIVAEDGKIFFLEINTIPGMTKTSLLPKEIKAAKLSLKNLLFEWIDSVV